MFTLNYDFMTSEKHTAKFKLKDLPELIVKTSKAWFADDPFRLGAIIAYYAVISLPGLVVIIVNLVGSIWGYEIVQGRLTEEFSSALGSDAATAIETIIKEVQQSDKNILSTVLGISTIIFGATGVFYQLKLSLNDIWNIEPKPNVQIWKVITDRALSFAFILVVGFLLLVSFLVTAAINALSDYIEQILPEVVVYATYALDIVLSIGIISVLFALMFKYLPDAKIRWKTVWIGAIITSVLFVIGKSLLGFYFGQVDPGSTYGAAGIVVLVLLWVSYSSMIFFFGAEFTYAYSEMYRSGIKASGIAKKNKI
jgi:membrane protein